MNFIYYYFNLFILALIFAIVFFFKEKKESILDSFNKYKNLYYIYLISTPLTLCWINSDLWFLISAGRELLKKGFVKQELLTYHTGLFGIQQQWPIAILFNVSYKMLGIIGPYLVGVIFTYLIIFILIKLLNRINYLENLKNEENSNDSNSNIQNKMYGLNVAIVSIIINIFGLSTFITTRPYVFSTFLLLVEIYLLESYIRTKNKKYAYGLPIVSIMLINSHASVWTMFFVFLLPYLVDLINIDKLLNLKDSKKSNKINKFKHKFKHNFKKIYDYDALNKNEIICLLLMIIISAVAGFINPYGIDAITYGFHSYGIKEINDFIIEMKPTFYENSVCLASFLPLVILPTFTFMARIITKNKNIKMRYIYFALGTGLMSIFNRRNAIFFIVILSMNIAYAFSNKNNENDEKNELLDNSNNIEIPKNKAKKFNVISFILIITIFALCGVNSGLQINKTSNYQVQYQKMFNYLDENTNKDNIKLFAYYDIGGHAEFYGYKPYMDPRAEVLLKANNKKADYFIDFYNFFNKPDYYNEFLNKNKFTHMLIPNFKYSNTVQRLKKDNRFRIVMKEDNFILFESVKYKK